MGNPSTDQQRLLENLRLVRPKARYEFSKDQFLMIGEVMRDAANEIERLERERAEWSGIAAVRNRNIALIAEERDTMAHALIDAHWYIRGGRLMARETVLEAIRIALDFRAPALDATAEGK